jgi:DNA polymerase (family 10)
MKPKTPTLQHNRELADIFLRMSQSYSVLGTEHRFRANAYAKASRTLANLAEPVDLHAHSIKELDELPGVGESIAEKILEYLQTGKISTYEKIRKEVPTELLDLMEIEGIGPSTLKLLINQGIHDRAQLLEALEKGSLDMVPGLSGQKLGHIRQVLKVHKPEEGRMPLAMAWRTGKSILSAMKGVPELSQLTLAGSLRREKETVGDIDLVGVAMEKDRKRVINRFIHIPNCQRILARGTTRASIMLEKPHVQVDLRLVGPDEFGSALLHFTGSREHNIQLRTLAHKKGWKLNEYGVFDAQGKRLAGATEESIYALFGLPFIPPQMRIGRRELVGAK